MSLVTDKLLILVLVSILVGWLFHFFVEPFLLATSILANGQPEILEGFLDATIKGLVFFVAIAFGFRLFGGD